jgi:putative endonuclease
MTAIIQNEVMAKHNETGKRGESLALDWLSKHHYEILFVNWRHSHFEIDIIANKGETLHFIEVKTRNGNTFGHPEESISDKKLLSIMNAAEEFLFRYPEWKNIQYDVLSITLPKNQPIEYFLIEDVYYDGI